MFTNRYYIRKLSTDGKQYSLIYQVAMTQVLLTPVCTLQGLLNVVSLDFDLIEDRLYFADVQARKIQRIFFNGTGLETLVWHNLPGVEGLTVDWVGRLDFAVITTSLILMHFRKLYWVDNKKDRMFVSELNGTSQRTLLSHDLSNPRAMVAHPSMG